MRLYKFTADTGFVRGALFGISLLAASLPTLAAADPIKDCKQKSGSEAINACTQAINRKPGWAEYYNRGLNYQKMGDLDLAVADYNKALTLNPKYSDAYINRGLIYVIKGDLDRALSDDSQAILLNPNSALAYSNRAHVNTDKGNLDQAIADYSQALTLRPNSASDYNNRGNVYRSRGEIDRALSDYNQAIALDAQHYFAYNGRGLAYYQKGDLDQSFVDYNRAIALNPSYADSYTNRGQSYTAKGDLDRAIADFNQAITLNPKSNAAYNNRGMAFEIRGDFDRAIADFDQAIAVNPKDASLPYLNRGIVNFYAGSQAKALADMLQAGVIDTNYRRAALWVEIVSKRGNLASSLAQSAVKLDMTTWPAPIIRLYLGQLTPQALLEAADGEKGRVCEANFFSAELALSQGSKPEAAKLFRQVVDACPQTEQVFPPAVFELKQLRM